MRRVALLSSYSPSLIRFRGPLIRLLVGRGYEVTGCGPEAMGKGLDTVGARFSRLGPGRTSLNPLGDLWYLLRLVVFLLMHRSVAVIAYTAKPVIWGNIAAWICRVPVRVAMITGLGYAFSGSHARGTRVQRTVRLLYRIALDRSTCVIFQNPDDRDEFVRLELVDARKAHVVNGSGVDLEEYRPVPLPGKSTFLLIARLLEDKGIREYASAARKVRQTHPEARFLLVGWSDVNPRALRPAEVESWVHEGLIEFLGRLEDVRPAMARADIFVLPSYREGTPRTVLEAMAMGRPIITTDVPGCRQTVEPGINGLLVPAGDANRLAEAMARLLDDPQLAGRMGRESQRMARERFDATSVAGTVLDAAGL